MLATVPVAAEGEWNSKLDRVLTGFNSRQWFDGQSDAADTTVTMSGCSRDDGANHRMRVELRRVRFGPDVNYGRKDFDRCNIEARIGNWGRPGARGDYYVTFNHYDFGRASATAVRTRY